MFFALAASSAADSLENYTRVETTSKNNKNYLNQ